MYDPTVMANTYVSGFIAIAGVSITVLTLVLGFSQQITDKRLINHVVAALTLATASCFVGTQLMSKTEALREVIPTQTITAQTDNSLKFRQINQFKSADSNGASKEASLKRSYMVGSPVIYMTGALFLYALSMLPTAFSIKGFASRLPVHTFAILQIGTYAWHCHILSESNLSNCFPFEVAILFGSLLGGWFSVPRFEWAAYYWNLVLSLAITFYFTVTLELASSPLDIDYFMYYIGAVSGPAFLLGLCLRLGKPEKLMSTSVNPTPSHSLDVIAKLISAATSPFLVILSSASITIWSISQGSQNFLRDWIPFAICIIAIPIAFIAVGIKTGRITDLHVQLKEQRSGPFLIAVAGACLLSIYYGLVRSPIPLLALAVNLVVNGVIFFFISKIWKISVHNASWVGSTVILGILVNPLWFVMFCGVPFVAWARLRRKRHDLLQALAAAAITGSATYLVLVAFHCAPPFSR